MRCCDIQTSPPETAEDLSQATGDSSSKSCSQTRGDAASASRDLLPVPPHSKKRHLSARPRPLDPHTLIAVNNSPINTYGQCSLTLNLGLRCSLPWIFLIAEVQKPILGADFLSHYGLTVDVQKSKLIDTNTRLCIQGIVSCSTLPSPSLYSRDPSNLYLQLLSELPELSQVIAPDTPVKHDWPPTASRQPNESSNTCYNSG